MLTKCNIYVICFQNTLYQVQDVGNSLQSVCKFIKIMCHTIHIKHIVMHKACHVCKAAQLLKLWNLTLLNIMLSLSKINHTQGKVKVSYNTELVMLNFE